MTSWLERATAAAIVRRCLTAVFSGPAATPHGHCRLTSPVAQREVGLPGATPRPSGLPARALWRACRFALAFLFRAALLVSDLLI